jgi:ribosome-associated protein
MTASAEARDTALLAAQAAADKLATDVSIVDVSDRLAITDAFVLASAPNERQVQSIVDEVEERLREHGIKPVRREGVAESRGCCSTSSTSSCTCSTPRSGAYYALERLWKDCPVIPFTDRVVHDPGGQRKPGGRRRGRRSGDDRPVSLTPPVLPVSRLVLWRHGRTEWNAIGRFQGHLDPPLDDLGRAQAARPLRTWWPADWRRRTRGGLQRSQPGRRHRRGAHRAARCSAAHRRPPAGARHGLLGGAHPRRGG